jgi:hypothetical protein
MSQTEILGEMLEGARGPVAEFGREQVRSAGPIRLASEGGQQFRTPSEKLEFYSEALAAQGLPALPDWLPDPDDQRQATRWPLRLLTAPSYFQSHTAFAAVAFLRRREGVPCCILHPQEAGGRGLSDGQRVRLTTIADRSVSSSGSATRFSPGLRWSRDSGQTVRRRPAQSTCCAPTATPISARAPPTRAPGSTSPSGQTADTRLREGWIELLIGLRGLRYDTGHGSRPLRMPLCGHWHTRYSRRLRPRVRRSRRPGRSALRSLARWRL